MLVVPFFRIRIGVFNLGPGVLRGQEEISDKTRQPGPDLSPHLDSEEPDLNIPT